MELSIIDHDSGLSYFTGTLAEFFTLSSNPIMFLDIVPGESRQYDYSVYFTQQTSNDYQGKTLSFDIVIISETDEEEVVVTFSSSGNPHYLNSQTLAQEKQITLTGEVGEPGTTIAETLKKDKNIIIKGFESGILDPTGFSNKEFIILLIFTVSFFLISRRLRKKRL